MGTILALLGIVFLVVIVLAFFTNVGKDYTTRTNDQLLQLIPFHVKNIAAQKNVTPEAYKKALNDFARLTEEMIKRGLRSDTEINDFDLGRKFLSDKFGQTNLVEIMRRASAGDSEALYYLASAKIVTQEEESAFRLLTTAAESGFLEAQYMLGHGYLNAKRVPKDMIEAQKWFLICAARGKADAKKTVEISKQTLPPDIIHQAEERASAWLRQHGMAE